MLTVNCVLLINGRGGENTEMLPKILKYHTRNTEIVGRELCCNKWVVSADIWLLQPTCKALMRHTYLHS
jgi:hypothetical protein